MKFCEDCKHSFHKPNIIGGITKCLITQKPLMTFEMNFACKAYEKKQKKEKNK